MLKDKLTTIFLRFIVICLMAANVTIAVVHQANAQIGTEITISPATSSLDTCEELEISVRVENVIDLTGYHLDISFEPGSIEILSITNGGFLSD